MTRKHLIGILAGGWLAVTESAKNFKRRKLSYIKDNILGNEFVTRDEHQRLRDLTIKLSKELEELKSTK